MCDACDARGQSMLLFSRRNFMAVGAGIAASVSSAPVLAQSPAPTAGAPAMPGEFVIRNATVLSVDPTIGNLPDADIHVRDGVIVAVGPNVQAANVASVNARRMIAIPGMIDTHWHMWGAVARNMAGEDPKTGYFPNSRVIGSQFSPLDNARGVRLALAESLYSGITTVHNWSHNLLAPDFADAEIAVHRGVGSRARFSYGYSRNTKTNEPLPLDDLRRVHKQYFGTGNKLLTLGMASRGPESNTMDICKTEWGVARELGIPVTSHMATAPLAAKGVDGVKLLNEAGLLGPDVLLVHCTNNGKEHFDILAKTRTAVSLSPYTEMRTGFGFPPIREMLAAGVQVSFSIDTTLLCGNADMFAIMKAMQNVGDGAAQSEFEIKPQRMLEMATLDGAKALGLENVVGSITPGKRADIVLVRTDALNMAPMTEPVRMIVQAAQPHNVDSVIVDGRFLKQGGRLTTIDVNKVMDDAQDTIDRVLAKVRAG